MPISRGADLVHLGRRQRDQVAALPQDLAGLEAAGRHVDQLQHRARRHGLAAARSRPPRASVSPRSIARLDAVDRADHAVVGLEPGLQVADVEQRSASAIRPTDTRRGSSASRRPSPMKLMDSTARKIAAAREQRPVRRDVEIVLGVEQHAAPGRDVGREAEAEEGQRRFRDDGGGDIDRAGHDHRAQRVGQDVARPPGAAARRRARGPPRRIPSRAATGTARAPAAPPASSAGRRSRARS